MTRCAHDPATNFLGGQAGYTACDNVLDELGEPDEGERYWNRCQVWQRRARNRPREPSNGIHAVVEKHGVPTKCRKWLEDLIGNCTDERLDKRPVGVVEVLQLIEVYFVGALPTEQRVDGCCSSLCSCEKGRRGRTWNVLDVLPLESGEGDKEGRDDGLPDVRAVIGGECMHILVDKVGGYEVPKRVEEERCTRCGGLRIFGQPLGDEE